MRFEELTVRIPGDELRMRFHGRLTVLAGLGAHERAGMVDAVLGTLAGTQTSSSVLCYTDTSGRRVRVTRDLYDDLVHAYDDGAAAVDPLAMLGLDHESLRQISWVQSSQVIAVAGRGAPADPPELVEARAALEALTDEVESALSARQMVEAMREELSDLDERLREAEEGRAKRRYARLLADLARVRAEASAIRGGQAGADADRTLITLAQEAHRLSERWHRARKRVAEMEARFGNRERLDGATLAEATAFPNEAPEELDLRVRNLERAEARQAELEARLAELATAQLPQPSHPAVVRLARADQDGVWRAAERALLTRFRLESASLDLGGLEADGLAPAVASELEVAHSGVEEARRVLSKRKISGTLAAGGALAAGAAALPLLPVAAPVALVGAAGSALWSVVKPKRKLAQAMGEEEECLARAGIPSYLSFHLRRVDATVDPSLRQRLDVAAIEHRVAMADWHEIGGEVDPADALGLEDEVREYAAALADLDGAADEIEAVRMELATVAEPETQRTRAELLRVCAPYGVDDPQMAASMVRHQITTGETARLQRELEAAEQAESRLRADLDELLDRVGFPGSESIDGRVGNLDHALKGAAEREEARAAARDRALVERELAELEAQVRQERRPEWDHLKPEDGAEPDVEELRRRREEKARTYDLAGRLVPDVERLEDRRRAVERRVGFLERSRIDLSDGTPAVEPPNVLAEIARYLTNRVEAAANPGPGGEPLPLFLDEPFLHLGGQLKSEALAIVERLATRHQIVYLSDDPDVVQWARRRAAAAELLLLEPVGA